MKTDKNDINSQTMAATETHRPDNWIEVYGAREHNLKNVDVSIPRDSLTVITGLSVIGFRYDLCRGAASVYGDPVNLCSSVCRFNGTSRCG